MLCSVIYWLLISKTDLIPVLYNLLAATLNIWIWHLDLINGAHSCLAIRGNFSINNGDSSQNITFKIRVRKLVFGSKNQDFFSKTAVFFQTKGYQNRWPIETLKKQEQSFSQDSNLGTKTKTDFTLSPFTTLLPVLENSWQISRLFQEFKTLHANPENEFAFFQTLVH